MYRCVLRLVSCERDKKLNYGTRKLVHRVFRIIDFFFFFIIKIMPTNEFLSVRVLDTSFGRFLLTRCSVFTGPPSDIFPEKKKKLQMSMAISSF